MSDLALKIDVDTYDGMRCGVPNFLKLFRELGIKATFFIPFGPDESGKAVFRVFRKKGFLKKMYRTNALKLYSFKTMLRGTLLPAPMIGSSFPGLVKQILDEGHELGIHGYNHTYWHDHLLNMDENEVRAEFTRGISAYEKVVGKKPLAFAAPAWMCTPKSLKMLDAFEFSYASDSRGRTPFFPSMDGIEYKTLQIPSTLPTLDEILGHNDITQENAWFYLNRRMEEMLLPCHVHTIHTEVEGTAIFENFSKWLTELKGKNFRFIRLCDFAASLLKEDRKSVV